MNICAGQVAGDNARIGPIFTFSGGIPRLTTPRRGDYTNNGGVGVDWAARRKGLQDRKNLPMNRPIHWWTWVAALVAVSAVWPPVYAQQQPPAEVKQPPPEAKRPPAKRQPQYRKLAPGVLEKVDPARQLEESFSRHDVVELVALGAKFDWAKDVPFRHDIWALEFRFKPIRMIYVDIPQPGGVMKRELIWYMVYSVTNPGKIMHPVLDEQTQTFKVQYVDRPVRFIPGFKLHSHEFDKTYPDRVIPIAVGPIRLREDRNRRFYTSVEMCREIAVGETVWGVATWMGLDQEIDRFSIYIKGLTNAYVWEDKQGEYQKGDPLGKGRRLLVKTLKLNFWRPGDRYYPHEGEIRYGIPGEVDYEWDYR